MPGMNCPREYFQTTLMIAGKSMESLFLNVKRALFSDVSSKTVKTFSLTENAVQCLAGTGIQGQTDGSKAEL